MAFGDLIISTQILRIYLFTVENISHLVYVFSNDEKTP